MRRFGLGRDIPAPLFAFAHDAPLKAHADYRAAKAGDDTAAVRLVADLADPLRQSVAGRFPSGSLFVAPHALEAAGDNAIPQVLAGALSRAAGARLDSEIVQTNKVYHTGADPMERLTSQARFQGQVLKGARYVLVDDVLTMGGTLAELADHIHAGGGIAVGVVLLVNASRTGRLVPDRRTVTALEGRFGDVIRETVNAEPAALTADEALYLIGFRSADEIRNRAAKAAEERDRRLRAKGVQGLG